MITLDFDKVKWLRKEYKDLVYSYQLIEKYNKFLKEDVKDFELKTYYKIQTLENHKALKLLKNKIKEAERDFIDDVKLFYLDFENHYGMPYKKFNNPLSTSSKNLKTNMKYFYFEILKINKQ